MGAKAHCLGVCFDDAHLDDLTVAVIAGASHPGYSLLRRHKAQELASEERVTFEEGPTGMGGARRVVDFRRKDQVGTRSAIVEEEEESDTRGAIAGCCLSCNRRSKE